MSEVNLICPVTHPQELSNIREIESPESFSILPADEVQNLKDTLRDIFNEMFEEINKPTTEAEQSPEVTFSKFLYVIKMKEEEIAKVKLAAEKLIQDIEAWQERKTYQHQSQIDFLSRQMENYLRQKQIKSMPMPSGTIGLRKQPPKIEIIDEDKFYEYADASLLRRVPESFAPDLKAIKERVKATGEVPKGVDVIEQDSKFYYKLN